MTSGRRRTRKLPSAAQSKAKRSRALQCLPATRIRCLCNCSKWRCTPPLTVSDAPPHCTQLLEVALGLKMSAGDPEDDRPARDTAASSAAPHANGAGAPKPSAAAAASSRAAKEPEPAPAQEDVEMDDDAKGKAAKKAQAVKAKEAGNEVRGKQNAHLLPLPSRQQRCACGCRARFGGMPRARCVLRAAAAAPTGGEGRASLRCHDGFSLAAPGPQAYKAKRFDEAISLYNQALELYDEDISFLTNR